MLNTVRQHNCFIVYKVVT